MVSGGQLDRSAYLVELGHFLKMRRLDLGLTQIELGDLVGYSPAVAKQAISQIERGVTGIPAQKMDQFINALQLDPGVFKLINFHTSINQYAEALSLIQGRMKQEIDQKTGKLTPQTQAQNTEKVASAGAEPSLEDKLSRLKTLFDAGLITAEDYDNSRKKLLDSFLGI